ncbi:serine protein kinase RIO [Actinoplanes derwentensis]|uniref:non-specific serine/threonine protein kinase n=1 Tax=Actinoplanes derwentensis TaxID=113562 RepID=A0A1H2BU13_9ACTN|nr:RIO1 family regulatory kinase/ATPase [Actinoplanes derwentensis]GID83093.1 RIO kinase 1 [Actinoplanes derwentensis]SDT61775.1 RIO kinase 1 [Actinoplanes derwentensis]
MREHSVRRGRRKFDDDDTDFLKISRLEPALKEDPDLPGEGDRWSTWDGALHGPEPRPEWVRTEHGAVDTELGMLKTGKEADVFLVRRYLPATGQTSMLAAKRYRDGDHRLFHRDAGYLEGRRVRRSREMRAMTNRTTFGKQMIAGQWSAAEFDALGRLWQIGQEGGQVCVPYPVQLIGTEVMMEFIGDWETGEAAPRLAQVRAGHDELAGLWQQMTDALSVLARAQVAHGDLSPYNTMVHRGRLVMIDLPQIIDVIANPRGGEFIARDVKNVAGWFRQRGLAVDENELIDRLLYEAGLR